MTDIAARVAQLSPEQRAALVARLLKNRAAGRLDLVGSAGIVSAQRTGDTVPLSFTQERIWFLEQFNPGTSFHNMSGVARLPMRVDPDVFGECVDQLVQRHEILRTRFVMRDGDPVGVVAGRVAVAIKVLEGSSASERERLFQEDAERPFDLSVAPLLRVTMASGDAEDCFIQLTMHHVISDGFSTGVFFRELGQLYRPRLAGKRIELPPLPFQFADFAAAERREAADQDLDASLAFWVGRLRGVPQQLQLPASRRRPARMTNRGRRLAVSLPADLVSRVGQLSQQLSVTPFVTMFAAFAAVLGRYSGQDDLVVGVPVANRERPGVTQIIGPFLNTLAMRVDLGGAPSFAGLVAQVNRTVLEGFEHQAVPFERVLHAVQGGRDPSRSPLIQAAFNFQVEKGSSAAAAGTQLRELPNGGCDFDLLLGLTTTAEGVAGHIDYYADVYDEGGVQRLVASFVAVLRAATAHPDAIVEDMALLAPPELDALVANASSGTRPYDRTRCVDELVLASAERHADRVAFVEGNRSVTYATVAARSAALAAELTRRIGVVPAARVAICLPRSVDMVVAILGVLRAGYTYIPLDPTYPAQRIEFICDDADIAAVLTRADLAGVIDRPGLPTIRLDEVRPEPMPDQALASRPDRAEECAFMIYTSGSTGRPKGVQVSHHSVVNLLESMRERPGMDGSDVLLAVTSPSFDIAVVEMLLPLLVGARTVLSGPDDVADGRRLAALLDEHKVSMMQATPATWHLMVESGWRGRPGLRVITGGETLTAALADTLLTGCAEVWNMYGPTETTIYSTIHRVTRDDVAASSVPIGGPVANTTLFVLDHGQNPVPAGVLGELWIGGDGVAIGYHQRPELNAAAFTELPLYPGHRLYRSGDLVRMRPGGELDFAGRRDHQVKVRGHRIELGEIEAVLSAHPRIVNAAAVVEDATDPDTAIIAYVQLAQPAAATPEAPVPVAETLRTADLKIFLRQRLPEFMVPARILQLAALPLTPNGKIDRRALPGIDATPDTGFDPPAGVAGYVAPRNETEERMVAVWQALLEQPRIGVEDNFFDLGGHSLLATKLIFRLREAFGVELPLQALFEGDPTVAHLALLLTEGAAQTEGGIQLNLAAEAYLPPDIRPSPGAHVHSVRHPQHVLLTGATGFVGAFLVEKLLRTTEATLFCLVRASSEDHGTERIRSALTAYGIWDPAFAERIIAIPSTLSRPHLGLDLPQWQHLAATVDVIYHCGADVNFLQPYQTLKPANVLGTVEVLRLACDGSVKPVHFVSTTYVFDRFSYPSGTDFAEDMEPIHDLKTTFGYTQTKWVSEHMVREAGRRGMPVYVYRCGRVAGHSRTGACQTYDFVWQVVKVGVEMGVAPVINMSLDITPVDYVVAAMVHISRKPELQGSNFHLVSDHAVREIDFVTWLENYGYQVERAGFGDWCQRVVQRAAELSDQTAGALAPFLSGTLPLDRFPAGGYQHHNVDHALEGTKITCPPIDDRLLRTYFDYFTRIGYLPTPRTPALVGTTPVRALEPTGRDTR
jgi:amino acid adenylation domain-containing protein/thioester reductase-like protein